MRVASLGSGSRGNATVVCDGRGVSLLIDCGLGVRQVSARLEQLGLSVGDLDALFVTHEHGDHCKGVAALARKTGLPVYMTQGTAIKGGFESLASLRLLHDFAPVVLGSLLVTPVAVPHDAREPCQFVVEQASETGSRKLGILTDLGSFTPHVLAHYAHCDALVLECNHDVDMLDEGPYPPSVKRRVRGDWGHLSNEQAGHFLQRIDTDQLQWLVVAHVSEQNNCPQRALQAVQGCVAINGKITLADQSHGFDWLAIH